MKKAIIFLCIVFFLALSYSEFRLSRSELLRQLEAPSPTLEVLSPDSPSRKDTPLTFTWKITAESRNIPSTAIYYDYQASPSALTIADSPAAVGYRFSTPDYRFGSFPIPYTFSASIIPPTSGNLYFRAYTFVNNEHLWSKEYSVLIQ